MFREIVCYGMERANRSYMFTMKDMQLLKMRFQIVCNIDWLDLWLLLLLVLFFD